MKKNLLWMAFVLAALFFPRILLAAASPCNVTLSPADRTSLSASGAGSISVTAAPDCAWTSSIDVSWISYAFLSSTNGVGNGVVNYMFTSNPTANSRTGRVTVNGNSFAITQAAGLNCSVTISPANSIVSSASGTGSVSVTASNGCAWTAISNASWIDFAVLSSSSGTGNGAIQYVVSANTSSSSRTGTITISGQTFTITQSGSGAALNNLLTNPGFESGVSSWTESSGGGHAIIDNDLAWTAHAGSYYAWLGGYNSATDFIQQNVAIPADAQDAVVQFWYQIATSETNTGGALDNLTIDLVSAATGAKLATLKTLSNLDASAGWVQSSQFDVSAYKGQTVSLKFTATTNASNATDFLIDDVSVLTASNAVTPTVSINTDSVQRLYLAYFNRPADPAGLAAFEALLSPTVAATQAQLTTLAGNFNSSAEYAALYAGQSNAQIIDSLYMNLFGRHCESTVVQNIWAGWLTDGTYTFSQIALQLTYSAQGTDATAIANKLAASTAFTNALDTSVKIAGYSGTAAAARVRAWLATVTDVAATLAAAIASVDTVVASNVTPLGSPVIGSDTDRQTSNASYKAATSATQFSTFGTASTNASGAAAYNADAIQRLYVAYFNRPADPAGLAAFEALLSTTVAANQAQLVALAANFSSSAEYAALYAGQSNAQIIDSLYVNLFGHIATPADRDYWVGQLASGGQTFAEIALQLAYSAQGTDATAVANKLAAATVFTNALDTNSKVASYSGAATAARVRAWLAGVTDVAATLAAATASVAAVVSTL